MRGWGCYKTWRLIPTKRKAELCSRLKSKTRLDLHEKLQVYNCDPRLEDLFQASVLERAIHFWREILTKKSLLKRVNYNGSGKIPPQHPWLASVMTITAQVERDEVLYRDDPT